MTKAQLGPWFLKLTLATVVFFIARNPLGEYFAQNVP